MRVLPILLGVAFASVSAGATHPDIQFQTSDRCIACHNGLTTQSGEDVSIGFAWRASIMGNSARDPYWMASVRRESLDHPESVDTVEDDCSICHMPIPRYLDKLQGQKGKIFEHIPFDEDKKMGKEAADGVTCSVCHQINSSNFGKRESYNGNFVIEPAKAGGEHAEYGPFTIEQGQKLVMQSSSGGFQPNGQPHIRDSELCATCHTLFTEALGPGGKKTGTLSEQMPYEEWLHSDYRTKQSCQDCHMPEVKEPAPITRVLGVARQGLHRHTFVAANFFMTGMLNQYRDELAVDALPNEFHSMQTAIVQYLQTQAAKVSIGNVETSAGRVSVDVTVENLGGHKLPTAYPSRRAWIHFVVRDGNGAVVFESGALNPDGSIRGNDNDADPLKYEPHYREITSSEQVEIFEPILKDSEGHVTTGLLAANGYLKDNRILPHGFDKATAPDQIAVFGEARDDPGFTAGQSTIRYTVPTGTGRGPFEITAELWYEPIGFRWAHNLDKYRKAEEPKRFTDYYTAMSSSAAVMLCQAKVGR